MQKQARKWPVSVSITNLYEDLKARFKQCSDGNFQRIIAPETNEYGLDEELVGEYGIDASRIAILTAQNSESPASFLESAYKWLARLYSCLLDNRQEKFSAKVWLEAFYQARDQVCLRHHPYSGLAILRRAARLSPLQGEMSACETNLAGLCIYPFAPIFALNLLQSLKTVKNIQELAGDFSDWTPIRYRIEKGGWQWSVFSRENFEKTPLQSLLQQKLVKKACLGKTPRLEKTAEGLIICLN
jgi:hypothetical protein